MLAKKYQNALKSLSPEGQSILRDGQRRWLRYAKQACFDYGKSEKQVDCIKSLMDDRTGDMNLAATKIGPYIFSRIDYFYTSPDKEHDDYSAYRGQVTYLRIDAPISAESQAWNKSVGNEKPNFFHGICDGSEGDVGSSQTVTFATDHIISVRFSNWFYCHGAPHGYPHSENKIYVLSPTLHRMTVEDIFKKESLWSDFITDRCMTAEKAAEPSFNTDRDTVKKSATDIDNWSFDTKGLAVNFNPYTIGGYVGFEPQVIIPWKDLKPFLTPDMAFLAE